MFSETPIHYEASLQSVKLNSSTAINEKQTGSLSSVKRHNHYSVTLEINQSEITLSTKITLFIKAFMLINFWLSTFDNLHIIAD